MHARPPVPSGGLFFAQVFPPLYKRISICDPYRVDNSDGARKGSERLFLLVLAALDQGISPEEGQRLRAALWEHHRYLLAMLRYKTGDEDLAEDLLQDTYAAFLRRQDRPRFSGPEKLRNYLVSIALNKLRDHFRGKDAPRRRFEFRSEEEAESWIESLPSAEAGPEERLAGQAEEEERRALVTLAMEAIPEAHRAALELKFAMDLGNEEIASRLGLGLKAAESLVFRARQSFRKEFMKASLEPNGSASGRVHSIEEGPDES